MKKFAILSLFIGLSAVATSLSAAPAGLVQSREAFLIERDSAEFGVRPNVLADVATGDIIATKFASATVRTENMGSVVVSPASRVAFLENNVVSVVEGSVVSFVPTGQAGSVHADTLAITPAAAEAATGEGSIVVVERLNDGRVVVESVRDTFAVTAEGTEGRLATMSQGDKLVFVPTPAGWMIQDPVQGAPSGVRLVQDQADAAAEAVPQEEEDEEDRRRGWWFWPAVIGGGAVVAGGGGYLAWEATDGFGTDDNGDDDDDDGDDFPGGGGDGDYSPIVPYGAYLDPDGSGIYYFGSFGTTTAVSVLR